MKQTTYTTRVLEPTDGHVLTQAAQVPLAERAFSTRVYLAANDSPETWREITTAEAERLKAEQEAAGKEETNG